MNRTSCIVSHAVDCNNEGVVCLHQAQYDTAINLISRSLSLVKQAIVQVNGITTCTTNTADDDDNFDDVDDDHGVSCAKSLRCAFVELPVVLLQEEEMKNFTTTTSTVNKQTSFTFQKPIYIHHDIVFDNEGNECTVEYKYLVSQSFVLVYNLALAHHLSAMYNTHTHSCIETQQRLYIKALSLYELAYSIHETEQIQISILQTMALLNNVGQIHFILGDTKRSNEIFQELLNVIFYCTTTCNNNNNNNNDSEVESNDIQGFVTNVMPLLLNATLPPPAAAA